MEEFQDFTCIVCNKPTDNDDALILGHMDFGDPLSFYSHLRSFHIQCYNDNVPEFMKIDRIFDIPQREPKESW